MRKYKESRSAIPASLRREILLEAGYECSINTCREHTYLEIHHINHDREDNRKENLILLCDKHHKMAHHGTIDAKSLRAYKDALRSHKNSNQFVRAQEGDRVLKFAQAVVELLSYNDCGEISCVSSETAYRFEEEVYEKLFLFFKNPNIYNFEMRSYDPAARETQDRIVGLLKQLFEVRSRGSYSYDGGCWARFVPSFPPGARGYDDEIAAQKELVGGILIEIQGLMRELWDYAETRSH